MRNDKLEASRFHMREASIPRLDTRHVNSTHNVVGWGINRRRVRDDIGSSHTTSSVTLEPRNNVGARQDGRP
jgi:hypothetical protein